MRPDFSLETTYHEQAVFGFDEAGRGPLVGPVVAACVYIPPEYYTDPVWAEINDSKALTHAKREALFPLIQSRSVWGIGQSSAREIEDINILQASFLAMARAYECAIDAPDSPLRLGEKVKPFALIDGNRKPKEFPCAALPVIKGDSRSISIAAASILAKVARDRMMQELAQEHPHYGWERNAGYPTPEHLSALARHGITPHHRRSYAPVKKYA